MTGKECGGNKVPKRKERRRERVMCVVSRQPIWRDVRQRNNVVREKKGKENEAALGR